MLPPFEIEKLIGKTIKDEWGRLLSALTSAMGDLQLAEDCLQEASLAALSTWPESGVPNSPAGWLMTTARRKAIDRLRRDQTFKAKTPELSYLLDLENQVEDQDVETIPDKRLEMIFTCCHPALEEKTCVALTLRTLGGLTTDEIAKAFLDKSETMGQRLARAKKKIAVAGIPYEIPSSSALPERLSAVLRVIYLIFNVGYDVADKETFTRVDLSDEAIRLARILNRLMPEEPEVEGLLALVLLHDARRLARADAAGNLIPLSEQDRSRWNKTRVKEGSHIVETAFRRRRIGPYQLQAAISALHTNSPAWEDTDWEQIASLYGVLLQIEPSSTVAVNRAVAIAYAGNVTAALNLLETTFNDGGLEHYQPYFAALAELSSLNGQRKAANDAYEKAIELSSSNAEKTFLRSKQKKLNLQ